MLFNTLLFSGNANPTLAAEIASHLGVELGKAKVGRFSDGEVDVELEATAPGELPGRWRVVTQRAFGDDQMTVYAPVASLAR